MVYRVCHPGLNRLKESENLGATAVVAGFPLYIYNNYIPAFISDTWFTVTMKAILFFKDSFGGAVNAYGKTQCRRCWST